MTRTPLPSLLLVLALAAHGPVWAAGSPGSGAGSILTDILPANDPIAAGAFLSSPELQAAVKANDPVLFEKVFIRAAELKDMNDILYSVGDPSGIRLALLSRSGCQFCQSSKTMWAWIDKYYPQLYAQRRKDMHAVYWDWDQLTRPQLAWLLSHGVSATAWDALDLTHRRENLQGWAKDESAALMALNPKDRKEADAMAARIDGVYAVTGSDGIAPLWDRMDAVRTGLSGLERVKNIVDKMSGKSNDPAVRKAYEEARNAPTPEARLAALACVFDGKELDLSAVRALAPPRDGQTFDPRSRQTIAALLESGLMGETGGTWAGQELNAFFGPQHPLKVVVAPTTMPALAWYEEGALKFNEQFIENYAKSQGRTLDDLAKDHALLQPLLRELAPVFVHEATHQRQEAFANANGIPFYNGEAAEKEAMMVEALFVTQKTGKDPAYAAFLAANQDRSINVREALALSRRLQKDRAEWFGESVMATHYPEFLSISGQVWCRIIYHNRIVPPIEAELKRRESLPPEARVAADSGRDFQQKDLLDAASFQASLSSIGTAHLKDVMERQAKALAKGPDAYAAYVKRLADVTALTDARLDELAHPAAKPDPVPPPGKWRRN